MKGRGQRSIPGARPVAPDGKGNGEGSPETLAVGDSGETAGRAGRPAGQGLTTSHMSYTPLASPGAESLWKK